MSKIFSRNTIYYTTLLLFSILSIYSCSDEYVEEELCLDHTEVLARENPCCSEIQVFLDSGHNDEAYQDGGCCGYRLFVFSGDECPVNLYDASGNLLYTFTNESPQYSFTFCGGIRKFPTAYVIGTSFEDPCYTLDASLNPFSTSPFGITYSCNLNVTEQETSVDPEDCCPITVDVETGFSTGDDCCNFEVTISNPPCTTCSYKLAVSNGNDGGTPIYTNFGNFVNGQATLSFEHCESDNATYAITTDVGKVLCSNFTDQLNCN